jgi:hypothetical protein
MRSQRRLITVRTHARDSIVVLLTRVCRFTNFVYVICPWSPVVQYPFWGKLSGRRSVSIAMTSGSSTVMIELYCKNEQGDLPYEDSRRAEVEQLSVYLLLKRS